MSRKFKKVITGRKPSYERDTLPTLELLEHDFKVGNISESTYYRYRRLISKIQDEA